MGGPYVQDQFRAGNARAVDGPEARGDDVRHARRNELQKRIRSVVEDDRTLPAVASRGPIADPPKQNADQAQAFGVSRSLAAGQVSARRQVDQSWTRKRN